MEEVYELPEAKEVEEEEGGGGGSQVTRVFGEIKVYCLELLELLQHPKKHSSTIPAMLELLRKSSPNSLQPFFDYILFPLLLLLDAAIDSRSSQKVGFKEEIMMSAVPKMPHKVTDSVAEGVLSCLDELLTKCHLGSVEQMVVVLKKLTYGALLSPSEASEEFRERIIRCCRALISNLHPCSDESCPCQQVSGFPALTGNRGIHSQLRNFTEDSEPKECLLAFLQTETASAAVGHWLSLFLKAADIEAARGHRGSSKLRTEAFITLRLLVAKVGTADALAFFLPGVVSQFAKVLHFSKTMISGAAGSTEAIDQAVRGLAEYLMIVLHDDANLSSLGMSIDDTTDGESQNHRCAQSFLDELLHLPEKSQSESKIAEGSCGELVKTITLKSEIDKRRSIDSVKGIGALHVNRTKEWIEETSARVNKMLEKTFPHICVHPAKKVRQGLLDAIRGLLLGCSYTLKESRMMLLECLCVLAVDDSEEVSASAQEFLEYLLFSSGKHYLKHDIADIFIRLTEKLPKLVLGSDETVALSQAQQLLVVIYCSGPQLLMNHLLHSPVTAARFLDIFAVCMSQNSTFAGSLNKLISARSPSVGYLHSVTELKGGTNFINNITPSEIPERTRIQEKDAQYQLPNLQKYYELPRIPPWFTNVGSQKLYNALSGILRLVGLSLITDFRSERNLSLIIDIPLGYLHKLVAEVRTKEYNGESWQSWYNRTGSGQLVRQASTAVCILNEMIFGLSDHSVGNFARMFPKLKMDMKVQQFDIQHNNDQLYKHECALANESIWNVSQEKGARIHLIECIGRILHEYLSPEVWDLPVEHKSTLMYPDGEAEDISLHFFRDTSMLHQVIIDGIGIFNMCLGRDFASSGFLHSSLYLLLENLISSNVEVRRTSDAVLNVISTTYGYQTVGNLVLANADYVIDSICRQLRHLDLNPHVPNVLAAMLQYVGIANEILPLLEEPMCSVSLELEILGRHQHPDLTIPFLKSIAEIAKVSNHESSSLPTKAASILVYVKSIISDKGKRAGTESMEVSSSHNDDGVDMSVMESELEDVLFKLNDSRRYRRTVGSIAGSCITAAIPLLASMKQAACLVSLDIIEHGIMALSKVEEAHRREKDTKEAVEEMLQSCSLYHLQDTLDAANEETDENRLLPAMNKIWPFLVACIRNKNPVVIKRCLSVISNTVQICGGDFFSRRFHTDGPHFWKHLTISPFQRKPNLNEERVPLQLPYRRTSISSEESVAEVSDLKVQAALLHMIADLSRNKRSASALEVVLKKVSGLVVGIACSGVVGLHDASLNALQGLASMDPDLIWLLVADVYYSVKKNVPLPPTSNFPEMYQILPPPLSPKGYLYVQYGGQSYGFDINFSSVETVFKKLHFRNEVYG